MKLEHTWRRVLGAIALTAVVAAPANAQDQPNILVIWGDDIGRSNISAVSYTHLTLPTTRQRCRSGWSP